MLPTFLLASLIASSGISGAPSADTIFVNGHIITCDSHQPVADAIAVSHGRIVAVGTEKEVQQWQGTRTRRVDLNGHTLVPGFIDCHLHPEPLFSEGKPYSVVNLKGDRVKTMGQLVEVLKKQAAAVPKGSWIRGERYDDGKLGRHPTRFDLDKVSTDHPVVVWHVSGHIRVVNTYALTKAGITKDTPDPSGGAYDRDSDGVPNGVCRESASVPISIAPIPQPSPDERKSGYQRCFEQFLAKGITEVGDAGASPESLRTYQELIHDGCPVRINVMMTVGYLNRLTDLGIRGPFGDDHLRLGTIKVFHGNSFSGRTCWVSQAYEGRPNYFGIPPSASQEKLNETILAIHKAGFQAAVHSNGDREIDMVLTAFENAQRQFPRPDPRFRIEHCSVCTPEILRRAKAVGAVLVFHSYMWENGDKLKDFGVGRYDWLAPMARALAQGVHVTSHSDFSVSAADPMLRIQDLVTRRTESGVVVGAGQCVDVATALRLWTLDAAYATHDESSRGSIEAGKLADFAVLSADPLKSQPLALKDIEVLQTYIDGRLAWARGSSALENADDLVSCEIGETD